MSCLRRVNTAPGVLLRLISSSVNWPESFVFLSGIRKMIRVCSGCHQSAFEIRKCNNHWILNRLTQWINLFYKHFKAVLLLLFVDNLTEGKQVSSCCRFLKSREPLFPEQPFLYRNLDCHQGHGRSRAYPGNTGCDAGIHGGRDAHASQGTL